MKHLGIADFGIRKEISRFVILYSLQLYGQRMTRLEEEMKNLDYDKLSSERLKEHIERQMIVAEEQDKVTNELRKMAFPAEHI